MLTKVNSWKKLHLEIVLEDAVTVETQIIVRKGLEKLKLPKFQINNLVDKLSVKRSTETLERLMRIKNKQCGYGGKQVSKQQNR